MAPIRSGLLVMLVLAAPGLPSGLPDPLARRETAARESIAGELHRLGLQAVNARAFDAARADFRLGLTLCPGDRRLVEALARLDADEGRPRDSFLRTYEVKRTGAYLRCAKHLARVARRCEKEGYPEHLDRLAALARVHFPSDAAMEEFGLRWFEPHGAWLRRTVIDRLEAGEEQLDGRWLSREEVARLDAVHASASDPWILATDAIEIRTNLSLREAVRLLGDAQSYRDLFLRTYGLPWDLRAPPVRPVVVIVRTSSDRESLSTAGACVIVADIGPLRPRFQAALTRHLAVEYSRHDAEPGGRSDHQRWAADGIAGLGALAVRDRWGWRFTRPAIDPSRSGDEPGAHAWCAAHRDVVPGLDDFVALAPDAAQDPRVSVVLADFLLNARDGAYRAAFMELLERVHQGWATEKSFDSCFAKTYRGMLRRDWLFWLRDLDVTR